ncbi:hypothetical protein V866_005267 [Kwoniella sp. B9012]|uniref:Uncharacterized protein n=1 Tax=Kwoniella europaea PYCC6329 TaxID=1423913 RepID=A0AAX4KPD4_9TREE
MFPYSQYPPSTNTYGDAYYDPQGRRGSMPHPGGEYVYDNPSRTLPSPRRASLTEKLSAARAGAMYGRQEYSQCYAGPEAQEYPRDNERPSHTSQVTEGRPLKSITSGGSTQPDRSMVLSSSNAKSTSPYMIFKDHRKQNTYHLSSNKSVNPKSSLAYIENDKCSYSHKLGLILRAHHIGSEEDMTIQIPMQEGWECNDQRTFEGDLNGALTSFLEITMKGVLRNKESRRAPLEDVLSQAKEQRSVYMRTKGTS